MKFRTAVPHRKNSSKWVKGWATCMIVFALTQFALYQDGLYQNVDHDAIFWAIAALAASAVGTVTAMYLKKNSAHV